jgi:hydroxymethylpyrimidine/phosphomethylpyrimidine kinase
VSKYSLPIALIFGPFDPTGSDGLPADAVTCAALGVHALSVLTAVTTQDTADTESVVPCRAEQIDDQARCVLEDMSVQAIKVGALSSAEAVSAVAQVAADYSQVPLVLHLGAQAVDSEEPPEDDGAEDLVGATIELLVPQAHVVVMEARRLAQWVTEDVIEVSGQTAAPQALQAIGADWVLLTGSPQRPGHRVNVLVGPDSETITWPWVAPPDRVRDAGGIVATALAALLAQGLSVPEAARAACTHAALALEQSFAPGMGQRIAARMPTPMPAKS